MSIEMENINLIKEIAKDIEVIKLALSQHTKKEWLTTSELAEYLGYSKDRIYKLKDEHFIENQHFFKKTGKILFSKVAIDSWMVGKESDNDNDVSQRQIVDNILSSITKI